MVLPKTVVALALLLCGCASSPVVGPQALRAGPPLESCRWQVTKHPATLVYVEKDASLAGCDAWTVWVVTYPTEPCAWEVHVSPQDGYSVVNDLAIGECVEPIVACIAGSCP